MHQPNPPSLPKIHIPRPSPVQSDPVSQPVGQISAKNPRIAGKCELLLSGDSKLKN